MSDDAIIDDVIRREGGLSNDPADPGGLTYKGLSKRANPDLFAHGLPSDQQVHDRYLQRYIVGPGFDKIEDERVKSLLVDWGVNSGPAIAILALQRLVGVPADGVLGPETLSAIHEVPVDLLLRHLVAERIKMIGRILVKNPSQSKFALGWLSRAVEWLA